MLLTFLKETWYVFVIILVAGLIAWMTWPDRLDAEIAVRSAGNKNVVVGEWVWFGCSKSDSIGWSFTATNALEQPVSGTVCCGGLKSCTVRY